MSLARSVQDHPLIEPVPFGPTIPIDDAGGSIISEQFRNATHARKMYGRAFLYYN